jgi:glycosyltransferase involved in cell wall biosynthesis
MKLLFACANRANDPHHWSGTVSHCRQALLDAGVELALFDQIPFECPLPLRLLHQAYRRLGRQTHYLQVEPGVLQRAAKRIATRFAAGDCDAVFCPGTGVPVGTFLPPHIPVFSYLDATKKSWIRSYFGLKTLVARSRQFVDLTDRVGLHNHALTFFSSGWAQAEAAGDYQVAPERLAVVPFGANLTEAPERATVESWIATRSRSSFRLLFLGKEWERKGGPEALALVRLLRERGVPATLDIVGCQPALTGGDQDFVHRHGFIDHSAPAGRAIFQDLLRQTHVLLFLSRAEAYGIALCEAAAFGVPAYATPTGGIPTIVHRGENGWLAAAPFSAPDAAADLAAVWASPAEYARVALAARVNYETRLNWGTAGVDLKAHMLDALARRTAGSTP